MTSDTSSSLISNVSSYAAEPAFRELLTHLEGRVNQKAQLAELSIQTQKLRQEGELLQQAGKTQAALAKFDTALKVIETARALDRAGLPFPEFQYNLKTELQEVLALEGHAVLGRKSAQIKHLALNPQIRQFMRYFQGPGRDTFERTSVRLKIYRPMMERIFKEEGIPLELIFQAQIESGFDPLALSSANARGLWQFIPETGECYGLRQTGLLDERIDPVKSTRAAARYLKDLFAEFNDWPPALAAYNAGENRISQLIAKTGIRDFWTLSRLQLLPKETTA